MDLYNQDRGHRHLDKTSKRHRSLIKTTFRMHRFLRVEGFHQSFGPASVIKFHQSFGQGMATRADSKLVVQTF